MLSKCKKINSKSGAVRCPDGECSACDDEKKRLLTHCEYCGNQLGGPWDYIERLEDAIERALKHFYITSQVLAGGEAPRKAVRAFNRGIDLLELSTELDDNGESIEEKIPRGRGK